MPKSLKGNISRNAKTADKSSIYPKVVFKANDLDETIVIESAADLALIPDNTYLLVEPVKEGWGTTTDLLIGTNADGRYVISYAAATGTPPVGSVGCPQAPVTFKPITSNTGSKLDYRWRYDGTLNPDPAFFYQVLSIPEDANDMPFWWYSGPTAVDNGDFFVGGSFPLFAFNANGTLKWGNQYINPPAAPGGRSNEDLFGAYLPIINEDRIIYILDKANGSTHIQDGQVRFFYSIDKYTGLATSLPFAAKAPLDTESFVANLAYNIDELILCPDGNSFLALSEEIEGTYLFRINGNTTEFVGPIEGFVDEGEGMSSSLNFQHIPGKNEMYYSGYDSIARINCGTGTLAWQVTPAPENGSWDELFAINPANNNLIKTCYSDESLTEAEYHSRITLAEYSYVDGSLVKKYVIDGLKETGSFLGWDGLPRKRSKAIENMIGTRNCLIYIATGEGELVTLDLTTGQVVNYIDTAAEVVSNAPVGEKSVPDNPFHYYGTSLLTAENVWWSWYASKQPDPLTGTPTGVNSLFAYDGTNVTFYPVPITLKDAWGYDATSCLSIVGNSVYYGTNAGISRLVIGDDGGAVAT